MEGSGSGSILIIVDLDPDPRCPKTFGSYGSGPGVCVFSYCAQYIFLTSEAKKQKSNVFFNGYFIMFIKEKGKGTLL